MSSRRSSNVDEMVRAALAKESLLPKEKERWWAPYVIDFAVVCCVPPLAGGVSCLDAVVRVAADDDGVVPGRPGGGVAVGVAADDDGVVPGCPGGGVAVGVAADDDGVVPSGGAPPSAVWCLALQMTVPSRILWSGGMSPMESVAWRP